MSRNIRAKDLVLRCFALKRGGYWVAMCIDLDLAAQADTFAQAKKLLTEQMRSYVADALTVDSANAQTLLRRKAPLHLIALYHAIVVVKALHLKWSNVSQYTAPMPMIPAGA